LRPMTADARDETMVSVPIRKCPQCGVRQYAQVPYVAHLECVECGALLALAHSVPPRHWRTDLRKPGSYANSPHALPVLIRRGRP
jgi:hypothetical protein